MKRTNEQKINILVCKEEIDALNAISGDYHSAIREFIKRARVAYERRGSMDSEWIVRVFGVEWTYPPEDHRQVGRTPIPGVRPLLVPDE